MQYPGKMTDKEMDAYIQKIANGSMTALGDLYEELRAPVYRFALSIVKSHAPAEDIAQEVFLQIKIRSRTYQSKGTPRTWIFSIARNLAVSMLRQTEKFVDMDALNALIAPGADPAEMDDLSLLDILDPLEKEIVSMRVLADLKYSEIAQSLKMSYDQARWKYIYAMQKLKKHLTKQGEEGTSI